MKITYDPEADAMNIKFQEGKYDISKEVSEGIIIDCSYEECGTASWEFLHAKFLLAAKHQKILEEAWI